ncbi:LytR/AlgR family response regulator transcription factor [Flavobacterium sp. 1355]|uniref:LytR/AlgR family response regulator transcription factor n=1 Tax=Flavobacterium sp. 1355 TaxID=2806571 RepID=UPI001AE248E3|nr:LytTR family DNA-binding domain-containing protein [Flavobacterium sp. 1355]MBP1221724.1 DNA-binding LytR/AlgR family response regulator [Flavobacterium sp. 1355]
MKCIVIDDERIAREGLQSFIREFDFLSNAGVFSNAHLALEKLKNETVDLIFLDIEMPLLNGLEFAKLISDKPSMIIFTTAYSEYALKGYKVNAIDYLVKPIFFEDFKAAVFKAKKMYDLMYQQEQVSKPMFFKENGITIKVQPSQILYIKSMQNYIEIYSENSKKIIIHQTLKSIIDELPENDFLQIHRSYIVNAKYVTHLEGFILRIKEVCLPIARNRKGAIMERFKND